MELPRRPTSDPTEVVQRKRETMNSTRSRLHPFCAVAFAAVVAWAAGCQQRNGQTSIVVNGASFALEYDDWKKVSVRCMDAILLEASPWSLRLSRPPSRCEVSIAGRRPLTVSCPRVTELEIDSMDGGRCYAFEGP